MRFQLIFRDRGSTSKLVLRKVWPVGPGPVAGFGPWLDQYVSISLDISLAISGTKI